MWGESIRPEQRKSTDDCCADPKETQKAYTMHAYVKAFTYVSM